MLLFFLQWNTNVRMFELAVECQVIKLASDPWKTLDDCTNLYRGSLHMPYVSWFIKIQVLHSVGIETEH